MNKNPNKVIIPCRFSFLHCWEPDSVNGSEPKYSVSAIIPKSDVATVNRIKAAMDDASSRDRSLALFMGNVLMSKCQEVWVFGDTVSAGMAQEIDQAERHNMKIRYFSADYCEHGGYHG